MAIIWCGGEDLDFRTFTGFGTNSWYFDTAFARGYISEYGTKSNSFIATNPLWLSAKMHVEGVWGSDGYYLGFWDFANNCGILLIDRWSTTGFNLAKVDSGGINTVIAQGSISAPFGLRKIDMCITDIGTSANIKVYIDGVLDINYTGDPRPPGFNSVNCIYVGCSIGTRVRLCSELIVADEDTRLMRLKTLAPNASGDSSINWTGAYTDIDETTASTSDVLSSTTDSADFQCNLTGMPSGSYSVKAVKTVVYAVDGTGTLGVQQGVKTNSSVDVGSTQTCSGYWTNLERLMTVNPVTGIEWTPEEIEALQLNIRAKTI